MELLVRQDKRSPVVLAQIWYRVGSSYEHEGITGISHVLEHMMFKGTKRHPGRSFMETVNRLGGKQNAYTGRDYTAYYQLLHKEYLETALDLEADRMRNLVLTEADFSREMKVVRAERRMRVDSRPKARAYEKLMSLAFQNCGYHHPVLGWDEDLKNMRLSAVQDWYKRWYGPDNATLIVIGDVNPDKVLQLTRKYFSAIPALNTGSWKDVPELEQEERRFAEVQHDGRSRYAIMGFRIPSMKTTMTPGDTHALDLLANALGNGKNGRLYQRLITAEALATKVSVKSRTDTRLENLFLIQVDPAKGVSLERLEKAVLDELAEIAQHGLGEDVLRRVKAQVVAKDIFNRDSLAGQARRLGRLISAGLPWQTMDEYSDRINAVDNAAIRAVAGRYLNARRLSVVYLKPRDER